MRPFIKTLLHDLCRGLLGILILVFIALSGVSFLIAATSYLGVGPEKFPEIPLRAYSFMLWYGYALHGIIAIISFAYWQLSVYNRSRNLK